MNKFEKAIDFAAKNYAAFNIGLACGRIEDLMNMEDESVSRLKDCDEYELYTVASFIYDSFANTDGEVSIDNDDFFMDALQESICEVVGEE